MIREAPMNNLPFSSSRAAQSPGGGGSPGRSSKGQAGTPGAPSVITHFIAGYPSRQSSLEAARGLIAGGAFALEMQIPFSDPNADGPVIEQACLQVLESGFRVEDAFDLLAEIRRESSIPIFLMSYASLAFTPGVAAFVRRAAQAGASGLIVPDLTPGADEGLFTAAAEAGCPAVPVVVPSISTERLDTVMNEPVKWIYAALRSGITGSYTELGEEQSAFLGELRRRRNSGGPLVMAGFGIQTAEQVYAVAESADAAVAGSAIVKAVKAAGPDGAGEAARSITAKLRGAS